MTDVNDFPTCNFNPNDDTEDHQLIVQLAILKALRLIVGELRRDAAPVPDHVAAEAMVTIMVQGLAAELASAAAVLSKAADTLKYAGKGPESVAVWTAAQRAHRAAAGAMPGAASDGSPR